MNQTPKLLIVSLTLLLGAGAVGVSQAPRRFAAQRDERQDYAAFLALPAEQQARIRALVKDLGQEEPETQARLLQVMQRYVTWLERLPATDRSYVEASPSSRDRLARIREVREKQWVTSLDRPDRDRLERALRRREKGHAAQIILWGVSQLNPTGVPAFPLPLLDERQRLIAGVKQREQQLELERQLALTQGPERQEAMQRELNRLRGAFKDKPLTKDERQLVNQFPPDDMVAYIRSLVELAKKYNVPLPEPRRQPLLAQGLPPLSRDKLAEFLRDHFSEAVQKDYDERLKDMKKRPTAVAELTTLYWNTHPQELREVREQERRRKGKDVKPGRTN